MKLLTGSNPSTVGVDASDNLLEHFFRFVILNLAGSGVEMPAAAIVQTEFADIGAGAAIENRFADGKDRVLLL